MVVYLVRQAEEEVESEAVPQLQVENSLDLLGVPVLLAVLDRFRAGNNPHQAGDFQVLQFPEENNLDLLPMADVPMAVNNRDLLDLAVDDFPDLQPRVENNRDQQVVTADPETAKCPVAFVVDPKYPEVVGAVELAVILV